MQKISQGQNNIWQEQQMRTNLQNAEPKATWPFATLAAATGSLT